MHSMMGGMLTSLVLGDNAIGWTGNCPVVTSDLGDPAIAPRVRGSMPAAESSGD